MPISPSRDNPTLPCDQLTEMVISVVIPVRNEAGFISRTLDALLAQDYPPGEFEIIVVDGESTDRTAAIVREYSSRDSRIRLLANPKRWSSAARNVGLRAARGDVILIVDGHCQLDNTRYLQHVATAFAQHTVDCLGRPQSLNVTGGSRLQRAIAIARSSALGHHPDSFIYSNQQRLVPAHSVGVAYRRDVFEQVGVFDESFDACEDVEFNHRVDKHGMMCLLAPQLHLRYYPRKSLTSLVEQMSRYGRGRVRLCRKHPDTFSLKSFLPAVLLSFVVIGGLASVCWQPWTWCYLPVVGFYVLAVLTYSLMLALKHRDARLLFSLPCVFTAIHFGAGLGSWQEILVRARPFRWWHTDATKIRQPVSG